MVQEHDLGALNDRADGVGDEAADGAAAGLTEGDKTRTENAKQKNMVRCLDGCDFAIHGEPPQAEIVTESFGGIFESERVCVGPAFHRRRLLRAEAAKPPDDSSGIVLLKRMNIEAFAIFSSSKKWP